MSNEIHVTKHSDRKRYEASVDESTVAGVIDYQETSELVVLAHTEVEPAFEGRGVGSALARAAFDDIRERGLQALVVCPYLISWLRNHPEHRDLLYRAARPKVSD